MIIFILVNYKLNYLLAFLISLFHLEEIYIEYKLFHEYK